MYTTDGVSCYITPLWKKENIRTNLCDQSGIPLKPEALIPASTWQMVRCSVLKLQLYRKSFFSCFLSLCLLLCESMRGEEAAASMRSCDSAGTVAGFPNLERKARGGGGEQTLSTECRVQSAPPIERFSFDLALFPLSCITFFVNCKMITLETWTGVFLRWCLTLRQESSVFGIRATETSIEQRQSSAVRPTCS